MFTTIDAVWRAPALIALALVGLGALQVVLPFVAGSGRAFAITGDSARAAHVVAAAGGQIIAVRGGVLMTRSGQRGYAAALYRAGAPLVLLGRAPGGCVSPGR
jgi:hypothetical protein